MDTRLDTVAAPDSCRPDNVVMALEEGEVAHHVAEGVAFAIVEWIVGDRRSTKRQSMVRLLVMAKALGVPIFAAHHRAIADSMNLSKPCVVYAARSMRARFPGFGGRSRRKK